MDFYNNFYCCDCQGLPYLDFFFEKGLDLLWNERILPLEKIRDE